MRQWPFFFNSVRLLVVLLGGLASMTVSAAGNQVIIVANSALAIDSINESELSRIYLLRQTAWADGSPIIALNREANNPTRELFTTQVLKQTANALASHWQQMHFKGKTPPLVQESDQAVLVFVEKVQGAIGYVSSDTPIGNHVKVLAKLP
jgi:ABC-type phosphate transport system substrate-binding protein